MELSKRKPNRLSDYDYNQNGAYFVTICTKDRKKILSQVVGDDAHIVPKPYGEIAEKYIRNVAEIEKYIIMPDHIHMIIRLDSGSMWASTPTDIKPQHNRVSNIVRSIKILTAKEIGEPIFQRSYYDHVIRNQQDYDEIWEYIPRKWVFKTKTNDPGRKFCRGLCVYSTNFVGRDLYNKVKRCQSAAPKGSS